MTTVYINGLSIEVMKGVTILQACTQAGIDIPRFCYHERLSIAGNCRMCLVEVEKSPKPVASCAMPVMDNMKIFTETPLVKKAREGVLEFLLVNHPLDCPICDQGGECDLQDLTMIYGSDRGRFHEYKRGVEDKNIGPLVKTIMTRCIHCTRCVRFSNEIAGVPDLGTVGRGKDTEISTYISKVFNSELSGNVIDLCPVGALTSKPFAFTARSWELQSTESVDVLDAVGSNIRIDIRGSEIMRVLPRLNEEINEEWISDKTRFSYDGLKRQRLTRPMIKTGNQLEPVSWEQAFVYIKNNLERITKKNTTNTIGIIGSLMDVEATYAFKQLFAYLGSSNIYLETLAPRISLSKKDIKQDIFIKDYGRSQYLFNTSIVGIEDSDLCLLIGANPRLEASLLNVRLRKRYLQGNYTIASIGSKLNLTYDVKDLGQDFNTLHQIIEGKHPFSKKLFEAKKPIVILGNGLLTGKNGSSIYKYLFKKLHGTNVISDKWNGFNVLHTGASCVGSLDLGLGYTSIYHNEAENTLDTTEHFVYLLGADDFELINPNKHFIVYQGHHGDYGANIANVILPGSAYTEKSGTYVNLEGRVQKTKAVFEAPGEGREDWKIIRALSEICGNIPLYNTIEELRKSIFTEIPHLANYGQITTSHLMDISALKTDINKINNQNIVANNNNFYLTNAISRASQIMAKCSKLYTIS